MFGRRIANASLLALAGSPLAGSALAQDVDRDVELALGGAFTSMDPHFHNATPNHTVSMHVFDRLFERQPDGSLMPALATEMRPLGPTRWLLGLRPDVTWHDGNPFTADDVAFTFGRARNVPGSPTGFGVFLRPVERVEVTDPLMLELHTHGPAAGLAQLLAFVSIVSRRHGEGATTADYNSGKASIGTGPFRLMSYVPGERVELVRHDGWWGGRLPFRRVTLRVVASPGPRVAGLLARDFQVIDTPPAVDLPRLRREPRIHVATVPSVRLIYMSLSHRDEASPHVTDLTGAPLRSNPLRDLRVRQALSVAINRTALTERIMAGMARPAGQWLPPGTYSFAPSVGVPPFDAARARQLLAEAGLPDGFRLTVHLANDRYPNGVQVSQAIAQFWTRIGVQTQVEPMPFSAFATRSARQEFSVVMGGWGSPTFEAGYFMANVLATHDPARGRGGGNSGRYSNPALDALLDRALSELDDAARERLLIQGVEMATAEVPVIPLYMLENAWATDSRLRYTPRADERTLAMNLHAA